MIQNLDFSVSSGAAKLAKRADSMGGYHSMKYHHMSSDEVAKELTNGLVAHCNEAIASKHLNTAIMSRKKATIEAELETLQRESFCYFFA